MRSSLDRDEDQGHEAPSAALDRVILCDTGPPVAAFNEADTDHARCAEFLTRNWSRLAVPSLAVNEPRSVICWPIRSGVGASVWLPNSAASPRRCPQRAAATATATAQRPSRTAPRQAAGTATPHAAPQAARVHI